MEIAMAPVLAAEGTLIVGTPIVIEGPSSSTSLAVVFEDDGQTGYFYALDMTDSMNPIQDAMHIYNVKNVADWQKPSVVHIVWSQDGLKAELLINRYPHAVFDFQAKRGYCRTGFPSGAGQWNPSHDWDDAAIQLIQ